MTCIKFSVYDDKNSVQKRTTYRIIGQRGNFHIEQYYPHLHAWDCPFVVNKTYVSVTALLRSAQLKSLFKKK